MTDYGSNHCIFYLELNALFKKNEMQQAIDIFVGEIITDHSSKNPVGEELKQIWRTIMHVVYLACKELKYVEDKKENTCFVKYIYFWGREHRVVMA